jgi:hypothetical protein
MEKVIHDIIFSSVMMRSMGSRLSVVQMDVLVTTLMPMKRKKLSQNRNDVSSISNST